MMTFIFEKIANCVLVDLEKDGKKVKERQKLVLNEEKKNAGKI